MDENEATIKKQLHNLIDWFAKQLPDSARATADLLKFAKMNDRRNYQLIRFCMAPESDYKTVHKAIVSHHFSPVAGIG
jgi:sister chromatid cohesion protein PDS5